MKNFLSPAGTIEYKPRTSLSPDAQKHLDAKLLSGGFIEQTENPWIIADWYAVEKDANRTPVHQTSVILFRNGGDSEEPAVIFYRLEKDIRAGTTTETCHIPPHSAQSELAAAWRWWEDLSRTQLETLVNYLERVIDTPDAWQAL